MTSRADRYPREAFLLLTSLQYEREALRLAESLTNLPHKIEAFIQIAKCLGTEPARKSEAVQLLTRAQQMLADTDFFFLSQRWQLLYELAIAFFQVQQWKHAEAVGHMLLDDSSCGAIPQVCRLTHVLFQAQQWDSVRVLLVRAEMIAGITDDNKEETNQLERFTALLELGNMQSQLHQWKHAEKTLHTAWAIASQLEDDYQKASALIQLGTGFVQAGQQEQALTIWAAAKHLLHTGTFRQYLYGDLLVVFALRKIGTALAQVQQWEQAQRVWEEVLEAVEQLKGGIDGMGCKWTGRIGGNPSWTRLEGGDLLNWTDDVRAPGTALAKVDSTAKWITPEAISNWQGFPAWSGVDKKVEALLELGKAFTEVKQWEQAKLIWKKAEQTARSLEIGWPKAWALREIARVFIQAHLWEEAETLLHEANNLDIDTGKELSFAGKDEYSETDTIWFQQQTIYGTWDDLHSQQLILFFEWGNILFQEGHKERAQSMWDLAIEQAQLIERDVNSLQEIGLAFARIQQWKHAQIILHMIKQHDRRAQALCQFGLLAIQNHHKEVAYEIWKKAELALWQPTGNDSSATTLYELGGMFLQAEQEDQTLAAWSKAKKVICNDSQREEIVEMLLELGETLNQTHKERFAQLVWDEVETVAYAIGESNNVLFDTRKKVFQSLVITFLQTENFVRALDIAEAYSNEQFENWVYREMSAVLASSHKWDIAHNVARGIRNNIYSVTALIELGNTLVGTKQHTQAQDHWNEAERILRQLNPSDVVDRGDDQYRGSMHYASGVEHAKHLSIRSSTVGKLDSARRDLCVAFASINEWKYASTLQRSIKDAYENFLTLLELGSVYIKNQQIHQARTTWMKARKIALKLDDGIWNDLPSPWMKRKADKRVFALCELGILLAYAKLEVEAQAVWKDAEKIAHTLEKRDKNDALLAMASRLSAAQQWESTWHTIRNIDEDLHKIEALCMFGINLAKGQNWEYIQRVQSELQIVISNQENNKREKVIDELMFAIVYAQAGTWEYPEKWEYSEKVTREINDGNKKVEALCWIGFTYAKSHRWELAKQTWIDAEEVGQTIEVDDFELTWWSSVRGRKARALQTIAREITYTLQNTNIIGENDYKREKILEIYEPLLHLIQRAWLRADIRRYAVELLPLASDLVLVKPELGLPLYDSFTWVENFHQLLISTSSLRSNDIYTTQYLKVLDFAKYEARLFLHNVAGPEHLLLGLIKEEEGQATKTLLRLGITLDKARTTVEYTLGRGADGAANQVLFNAQAEQVLKIAFECHQRVHSTHVDTEHILFGLFHEGTVKKLLTMMDITAEQLQREIVHLTGQETSSRRRPQNGLVSNGSHNFDFINARMYYKRGDLCRLAGDYANALENLTKALASVPDYPEAYWSRALTYTDLENYYHALNDFTQYIKLIPNNAQAYEKRGSIYGDTGEYLSAFEDFTRAIELDPLNAWLYAHRGNTNDTLMNYQEAISDLSRAIELAPYVSAFYFVRSSIYINLENYQQALNDLELAIRLDPQDADIYARRGHIHHFIENYQQALKDFDQAIDLDKENAGNFAERGATKSRLERYEEALEDFNQALELEEKYAWALVERGLVYLHLEDYARALPDFNMAVECDPDYGVAYMGQGMALDGLKKYLEAIKIYTQMLTQDGTVAIIYKQRALAYQQLKMYEKALPDYTHFLELESNDGNSYLLRGDVQYELGLYEPAIADYTQALELGEDPGKMYMRRAQAYIAFGNYPQAQEDLDRSQAANGNLAWIHLNRGWISRLLKDYSQALIEINHTLELDPNEKWAYFQRGYTYLWQKDLEHAQVDFLQAQRLDQTETTIGWKVVFVGMCQQKPGLEIVNQLETIIKEDTRGDIAHLCVGLTYYLQGDIEKVLEEVEQALVIDPEWSDAYFWKGMAYMALGKYEEALKAITKSLEEDLPPILLTPLHWLKQNHTNFYEHHIIPLLEE